MLHGENDDLVGGFGVDIINEVPILARYELSHALHRLGAAGLGKERQVSQTLHDGRSHLSGGLRICGANEVGDFCEIRQRLWRETQLHESKRRNTASISSSVANSLR